ncbi:hypothetical protein BDP81DRAFT_506698 [Colletotrichum phormii]|uniref:Uncharacterized protein n=1 Tax=Colletotrichum phormii TaxID=359342 RepID=A0AAI9ZED2_9PEZI|nr:uncharacterized protein BDP81DRAFT_506698 [Colletotrichum phormii]KAK1622732.1 hypothetical protein BDP81DRAFT_506698 [Colletotrichum phormii]
MIQCNISRRRYPNFVSKRPHLRSTWATPSCSSSPSRNRSRFPFSLSPTDHTSEMQSCPASMSSQAEGTQGKLDFYPASYFMPIRHGGERPIKVAGYTLRALAETCRSEERYNAAREALMSIIHILAEEIEMLRAVESAATRPGKQRYLDGWQDSLMTIVGVLDYCIVKPTPKPSPRAARPEAAHQLNNPSQPLAVQTHAEMGACRPLLSLETLAEARDDAKGKGPRSPDVIDIRRQEESADRWLDFIVGDKYRLPKRNSSLGISSAASTSSVIDTPSSSSNSSSAQNLLSFPPNQDTEKIALAGEEPTFFTSQLMPGVDNFQILLDYEQQCRTSERRIVAELMESCVSRQIIFHNYISRMPKFESVDSDDEEDAADGINYPFFSQRMYERMTEEMKGYYQRWRDTAWHNDTSTETDTETETETDTDVELEEASTQAVEERTDPTSENLVEDGFAEPNVAYVIPELNYWPPMVPNTSYEREDQWPEAQGPDAQFPVYQNLPMISPDFVPNTRSSDVTSNLLLSSKDVPLPSQSDLIVETHSPEDNWDLLSSSQDSLPNIEQRHASRGWGLFGHREYQSRPVDQSVSRSSKGNLGEFIHGAPLAASRTGTIDSQRTSAEPIYPASPTGPSPPPEPWTFVCQCRGCQARAARDQVWTISC